MAASRVGSGLQAKAGAGWSWIHMAGLLGFKLKAGWQPLDPTGA
jgi:hypothetical protein